jgi:2'-phosphotransferase
MGEITNKKSRRERDPLVTVSKALSRILRHQALHMGLQMSSDGFVKLADILATKDFTHTTLADIQQVVETNDKKRFELVLIDDATPSAALSHTPTAAEYKIRAVQGHSIAIVEDEGLLQEITEANLSSLLPHETVVHGTYRRFLPSILQDGLKRMRRNHIHLATDFPEGGGVISGMRSSCEIGVVVDVRKALRAGIPFALSHNGVVLSKGQGDEGVIPSAFFRDVVAVDGRPLDVEEEREKPTAGRGQVPGQRRGQRGRGQQTDHVHPSRHGDHH